MYYTTEHEVISCNIIREPIDNLSSFADQKIKAGFFPFLSKTSQCVFLSLHPHDQSPEARKDRHCVIMVFDFKD